MTSSVDQRSGNSQSCAPIFGVVSRLPRAVVRREATGRQSEASLTTVLVSGA